MNSLHPEAKKGDWMEEGIVPGGTESLLYSLIFPNNEVNSVKMSGELMKKMQGDARTVAQIKNESKAKQLARLEAATSKKRKSGDADELSSGDGAGTDALPKKQVPFAKYRACTENTRKELEAKKQAVRCHTLKNQYSQAEAVQWRGGKVEEGQPEVLGDSQKAPHEANSMIGVENKGEVWKGYTQQAEIFGGCQRNSPMSKHAVKAKTSVSEELPTNLWPLSKTEEEFVYKLNVDSPMRARYFIC